MGARVVALFFYPSSKPVLSANRLRANWLQSGLGNHYTRPEPPRISHHALGRSDSHLQCSVLARAGLRRMDGFSSVPSHHTTFLAVPARRVCIWLFELHDLRNAR